MGNVVFSNADNPLDWDLYRGMQKSDPRRAGVQKLILESQGSPSVLDLKSLFPGLLRLHLNGVTELTSIIVPAGLLTLDIRDCSELVSLSSFPESLQTIVVQGVSDQFRIPDDDGATVSRSSLRELSIAGCRGLQSEAIHQLLARCPALTHLDLSDTQIDGVLKSVPESVSHLRLNSCRQLRRWSGHFPPNLHRLELRGADQVTLLPEFCDQLEYVDLRETTKLKTLPMLQTRVDNRSRQRPHVRTLYMFGSGLPVDRELLGEDEDTNVADRVYADQQASLAGRVPDCQVKVILLGNGRCGKSSLAKVLCGGQFDPNEESTHGVRLWETSLDFTPSDAIRAEHLETDGRVTLNIWDFAGQDLYHSTHRLFLQSRAIFLVCDSGHYECPGSDDQTDHRELRKRQQEEDDEERSLHYWKEMVDSLGVIPGTSTQPPLLHIRTKWDRWSQDLPSGHIAFSASDRTGLDLIREWISERASELLGTWEQRSLPAAAGSVRDEIRRTIDQNRQEYWDAEGNRGHFQPSRPRLNVDDFRDTVTRLCSDEHSRKYQENPELLLERFHRSGMFYYSKDYLPNDIILDQRWVLQGIYAFSSRSSEYNCREWLKDERGLFTEAELFERSWKPFGYSPAAAKLFLSFMEACGMCFQLLAADHRDSGQALYAAPGFFPRYDRIRQQQLLPRNPSTCRRRFRVQGVSEADVRSVISRLGGWWGRSMTAWRWGCWLPSFESDNACLVEWQNGSDDNDHGTYASDLTLSFTSPDDQKLLRLVLQRLLLDGRSTDTRGVIGQKSILECDASGNWVPWEYRRGGHEPGTDDDLLQRLPEEQRGRSSRRVEDLSRETVPPPGTRIGFSYVGSRPPNNQVPQAVIRYLQNAVKQKALPFKLCFYQDEQNTVTQLGDFINQLAVSDVVVMFWSKEYWESEYCVYELIRFLPHTEKLRNKKFLVFRLGAESRISTNPGDGGYFSGSWKNYWKQVLEKKDEEFAKAAAGDKQKFENLRDQDHVVRTVRKWLWRDAQHEELVQILSQYRLGDDLLQPVSEAELNQLAARTGDAILKHALKLSASSDS